MKEITQIRNSEPICPHICGTSQKAGKFAVQRKTIGKRMAAKLKDIKAKLRQRMHESIKERLKSGISDVTPSRATSSVSERSGKMCSDCGCASFGGGTNGAVGPGSDSWSGSWVA